MFTCKEMKAEQKRWLVLYIVATFFMLDSSRYKVRCEPQVPCFFIFGDSLVDNGNNNRMATMARADYLPYGIDFPRGSTGRFSNGKTVIDVITELLGFSDYIQPHANATGRDILRGVNYASAAAGIRDETGQQLGGRISFAAQVNNYVATVSHIISTLGDVDKAANHINRCIFSVGLGSNDYLNNYFMPDFYDTSHKYRAKKYADGLILQYEKQIRILYNYGARKFVFHGLGPIGCSPNVLARYSEDGSTCVAKINSANQMFNRRLISLVDNFNKNLPGAKSIYINSYYIFQDLINRHKKFGFKVTNSGCCGVGRNHGQITCLPFQTPCEDRRTYIFWDAFHLTEAANTILGRRSYSAITSLDAYPIDIRRLAQL